MSAHASRPKGPVNTGQNIPDRYRCSLGGEWLPLSSFSKRQKKVLDDKLKRRVRIDTANTGMICRIHTGEPIKEIKCEGPCNEVRVLGDFSKSNRTNGVYVCKLCQHWTNSQEPGYAPWAAPKNKLDPLEKMDDFGSRLPTEPSDIFDFHIGNDRPLAPVTSTSRDTNRANSQALGASLRQEDNIRHMIAHSTDSDSIVPMRQAPASVVSDETNMSRLSELDPAVWYQTSQVSQEQTGKKIAYNGWDSTGQRHSMIKAPSVMSGSALSMVGNIQKPHQSAKPIRIQKNDPVLNNNPFPSHANRTEQSSGKSGFGSAPERQSDRKQMTNKEHREIQRTFPQNRIIMPEEDDDGIDEDSD